MKTFLIVSLAAFLPSLVAILWLMWRSSYWSSDSRKHRRTLSLHRLERLRAVRNFADTR
jgi:hypothetical protein